MSCCISWQTPSASATVPSPHTGFSGVSGFSGSGGVVAAGFGGGSVTLSADRPVFAGSTLKSAPLAAGPSMEVGSMRPS